MFPKNERENTFKRRTISGLRVMFNEQDIIRVLKSRTKDECGLDTFGPIREITMQKPDPKRPSEQPKQHWSYRVREDLKLLEIRNGELATNSDMEKRSGSGDGLIRARISIRKNIFMYKCFTINNT